GRLLRVINRVESEAMALGLDIRGTQPSPGNIRGGLTTIEEKSLGATHKGGERTPLADVVAYAAPITKKGLTVMDTPGLDVESVTGMVGGGAQVVVFTTGLGTPTGNPIAPVIKITGNARTAVSMADNIDLDVSAVLDGRETLDQAACRLFEEVLSVCSGRETAAERLGFSEFAIHRRNPTTGGNPMAMRMPTTSPTPDAATGRAGPFRWTICGLLFVAATINYVDRQVIGLLKPMLQQQFGWSEIDYADIVFSFQLAYAIGFVFAGRVIDHLGTRLGFSLALLIWSAAAIAHAFAPAIGPPAALRWGGGCGAPPLRPGDRPGPPPAARPRRPPLLRTRRRLHGRAVRAGDRRVGQLPRRHQDRGGVVSEPRTRARDRHLQRG